MGFLGYASYHFLQDIQGYLPSIFLKVFPPFPWKPVMFSLRSLFLELKFSVIHLWLFFPTLHFQEKPFACLKYDGMTSTGTAFHFLWVGHGYLRFFWFYGYMPFALILGFTMHHISGNHNSSLYWKNLLLLILDVGTDAS